MDNINFLVSDTGEFSRTTLRREINFRLTVRGQELRYSEVIDSRQVEFAINPETWLEVKNASFVNNAFNQFYSEAKEQGFI